MIILLFAFILLFTTVLQAFMPKFLKQTEAFGVYVPEQYTKEKTVIRLKNKYTRVVLLVGLVILAGYLYWSLTQNPAEDTLALIGVGVQFAMLFISIGYYFMMHLRVKKLKEQQKWLSGKSEVRVVDLKFQDKLKLIPRAVFIVPMIVTIGLIIYTFIKYPEMPDMIPTHWGPNGQPDDFSEKTYFSSVATLLLLLIMQGMFLMMSEGMRFSGSKINPANKKTSLAQQLEFRKYTSWFALFVSISVTLMMGYTHLQTIHPDISSAWVMFALPITFLVVVLLGVLIYTVKVGQSGSRIKVKEDSPNLEHSITAVDEDRYWKGGILYFNPEDPSILAEKRFGVGWTLNFGRPASWIIFLLPFVLILVIVLNL